MPAPEPQRPDLPATSGSGTGDGRSARSRSSELSAVPAFLREPGKRSDAGRDAGDRATAGPEQAERARTALPRPATPMAPPPAAPAPSLDPATLPMPSLSRRRVITVAGVLLAAWLSLTFVRQVGEATDATTRADNLRVDNTALRAEVEGLQSDLGHVQDLRFIRQEARGFGLGGKGEIPFALAAEAPALQVDAPGSASVRLGADPRPASPLDAWLEVLFGGSS